MTIEVDMKRQDDLPSSSPTQRQPEWQGSGNPGAVGTAGETDDRRVLMIELCVLNPCPS